VADWLAEMRWELRYGGFPTDPLPAPYVWRNRCVLFRGDHLAWAWTPPHNAGPRTWRRMLNAACRIATFHAWADRHHLIANATEAWCTCGASIPVLPPNPANRFASVGAFIGHVDHARRRRNGDEPDIRAPLVVQAWMRARLVADLSVRESRGDVGTVAEIREALGLPLPNQQAIARLRRVIPGLRRAVGKDFEGFLQRNWLQLVKLATALVS